MGTLCKRVEISLQYADLTINITHLGKFGRNTIGIR